MIKYSGRPCRRVALFKRMITHTIECPLCRGTGTIAVPEGQELLKKEMAVIILHKKGYLHREIKELMGYSREASITYILKKHKVKP